MIYVIVLNLILYFLLKRRLIRKLKTSYSISLKDGDGNTQTLTDTIAHLLEQNEINEKRIKYLVGEMENQWLAIDKLKMVTGADKYITEKPNL